MHTDYILWIIATLLCRLCVVLGALLVLRDTPMGFVTDYVAASAAKFLFQM